MRAPQPGEVWRHYKDGFDNLYEIVGLGWHTETNEAVVVYRHVRCPDDSCEDQELFVRPLQIFLGTTPGHIQRFVFERAVY